MVPPNKFQEALYRFNTMLLHIWFIVSDYFPHRIVSRWISRRAFKDSQKGLTNTWFINREHKRQRSYFKKAKKRLRKRSFKKANKKLSQIISEPLVRFDSFDDMYWVDTAHTEVGPFLTEAEAQTHADRIKEDYKVANHA